MWCPWISREDFRDWAEDVLFKVMTTGHYNDPATTEVLSNLAALKKTIMLTAQILEAGMTR